MTYKSGAAVNAPHVAISNNPENSQLQRFDQQHALLSGLSAVPDAPPGHNTSSLRSSTPTHPPPTLNPPNPPSLESNATVQSNFTITPSQSPTWLITIVGAAAVTLARFRRLFCEALYCQRFNGSPSREPQRSWNLRERSVSPVFRSLSVISCLAPIRGGNWLLAPAPSQCLICLTSRAMIGYVARLSMRYNWLRCLVGMLGNWPSCLVVLTTLLAVSLG